MVILASSSIAWAGGAAARTDPPNAALSATTPAFVFREVMIPMRDGVRLDTVLFIPPGVNNHLPILLTRTPYGVPDAAPDTIPADLRELAADGYIFVMQSIRGRFKSEGTFTLATDLRVIPGQGSIETRDAWDTIDWLVKHVPMNNGKVGMMGVSYEGYTAGVTLLKPHPALKAISEQAAPVDEWRFDDGHRYGALRLSYDFEYAVLEESSKLANTLFQFGRWDTYQWYLEVGPLSNINDRYLHGKLDAWNALVEHPDYDEFWKSQAWVSQLHRSSVPNLNVAGFWDQEDPSGPWEIFRSAAQQDPDHTNLLVAGPWSHGAWLRSDQTKLGPISLGGDIAREFREKSLAPFFAYWLHGTGMKPAWRARVFQTGSNTWRTYAEWPPKEAVATSLYLHSDGMLSFLPPNSNEKTTPRSYISDPANPVPYRPRPISPTYPGGDWPMWESGDQRFVDNRPDVLSFSSAPLDHDLIVVGPVSAEIYASTTGTDSDLIVKLIDVLPEDVQPSDWYASEESEGPRPGEFAHSANGYELPIAMEVRRGRYLASDANPQALTPNVPVKWDIPLRDRSHVFLKGHRVMLQIQSTWFPLIDRNPQTFTPSIYTAAAPDFVKAMQTVFTSPALPSHLVLPVLESQ
jgi:putative CocE/NonD family hydrolase